jgi:hypothetical protein
MNYNENAVFPVEELQNKYIPDDFYHLWSILAVNPEKSVKMKSILTDLKMIKGLYPSEIKKISFGVFHIINDTLSKTKENLTYFNDIYYYDFLAYCYLKYGLDGIIVIKKNTCIKCDESFEYVGNFEGKDFQLINGKISNTCVKYNTMHDIRFNTMQGYSIMYCGKCGFHKKLSVHTIDNQNDTLGLCTSIVKQHTFTIKRIIRCPYEDYPDEDNWITE